MGSILTPILIIIHKTESKKESSINHNKDKLFTHQLKNLLSKLNNHNKSKLLNNHQSKLFHNKLSNNQSSTFNHQCNKLLSRTHQHNDLVFFIKAEIIDIKKNILAYFIFLFIFI